MDARDELAVRSELLKNSLTCSCHDHHVDNNVCTISELDTDLGDRGTYRTHGERDNVHCTAVHAACGKLCESLLQLNRIDPVVRRAGIIFALGSDVGTAFNTGNVRRIGSEKIATRMFCLIKFCCHAAGYHCVEQFLLFCFSTFNPADRVRLSHLCDFFNPVLQFNICCHMHYSFRFLILIFGMRGHTLD